MGIIIVESPPTSLDKASGEHLPLEAQADEPSTLVADADDKAPQEDSGPSWLRPGFEMPNEEGALRELASEISNKTPPLTNICFTKWHAASFIRGAVLNRVANVESLVSMGEMGVDEVTNRVGALLARVS